jgi:hypothetical protein
MYRERGSDRDRHLAYGESTPRKGLLEGVPGPRPTCDQSLRHCPKPVDPLPAKGFAQKVILWEASPTPI